MFSRIFKSLDTYECHTKKLGFHSETIISDEVPKGKLWFFDKDNLKLPQKSISQDVFYPEEVRMQAIERRLNATQRTKD